MDAISPTVERRSRRIGPAEQSTEEVPIEELNDDEEERSRYRKQLENDTRNNSTHEKRFSFSEKTLSEHFQSCIQLAAENKITAKNAFSFKLIDLMPIMLKNKKEIHDFTEVSSSLDAGVKIYSCRVDKVHSDTLKMATTINFNAHKKKNDDETEGAEIVEKKKNSRKVEKCTVVTDLNQINRSKTEIQVGFSHLKLSNDNFISESALFDNNKMCSHFDLSSQFWKSEINPLMKKSKNYTSIELPDIGDEVICPSFRNFTHKGETDTSEVSISKQLEHRFEYDPPINEYFDDYDDGIDAQANDDFNYKEEELNTSVRSSLSKVMSSSSYIADITKLISAEKSEYCYFNTQLFKKKWNLQSMEHWNPLTRKKETERKKRTQKNEFIDFEQNHDLSAFEDESRLHLKAVGNTRREKFLITPVTNFSTREFFRLKLWREMYIIPHSTSEEQPSDLEENINDYNYNNPNDSQNPIPEEFEDDYENFNDGVSDVHQSMRSTCDEDDLLEIPNKVAKIQLPYMVKDRSVDIKKLKSKIWDKIEYTFDEIKEPEQEKILAFKEVCSGLLEGEGNKDSSLSVPILFNALLQLANDKSLMLSRINPNTACTSDFIIKLSH